jgi:hypothetical protein
LPSALADYIAVCFSRRFLKVAVFPGFSHISICIYLTPKSKYFYGIVDFCTANGELTTARDGSGSLPKLSRG